MKKCALRFNVFFDLFKLCCWYCSKPRWAAHSQNEAELPGSGPVLQRCTGIVGEKTDSSRQNDSPTRQGGDVPCTLPRWARVCMCKRVKDICREYMHIFCMSVSMILHRAVRVWCFEQALVLLLFVCRCSQKQAWGGLVAIFPSAPAVSQTSPPPARPGHPLPWSAEAAHRTAACYSGGSRWAHLSSKS